MLESRRAMDAERRASNPPRRCAIPAKSPGNPAACRVGRGCAGGARRSHATRSFSPAPALALLDQILRAPASAGGVEPVFAGALRQRLALKAAATCARLARLREDEAALRDAEHLSGVGVETSPAGRVHRLWRLFASRAVKFDAATLSRRRRIISRRRAPWTCEVSPTRLRDVSERR